MQKISLSSSCVKLSGLTRVKRLVLDRQHGGPPLLLVLRKFLLRLYVFQFLICKLKKCKDQVDFYLHEPVVEGHVVLAAADQLHLALMHAGQKIEVEH